MQYRADFCLGEPSTVILTFVFFTHRFMAMVSIEFGGLNKLTDATDNYHCNINKLYGNFNEFTLTIKKCCDMGQNDTISKIELNLSFVLSSDNTNYKNDIQ